MFIKYVPVSCQHYSHILMHGEPFPEGVLQNCGGGHVSLCPELHRNCSLWISHFWQLDHNRYFVVLWSGWMGHHCGFIDCHQDLHNLSYSPVLWQVLLYVSIFVKKRYVMKLTSQRQAFMWYCCCKEIISQKWKIS